MQTKLQQTHNREFFYALTSRLLMKEADEKLLELIESENIKEFFENYLQWDLTKKLSKEKLIYEHLNVDFADVGLLHLVPYETFYTREDAMIESGGENEALQFYDRFDFVVEKDKARVVSPDHIAVELEFVYKMIQAEKKALEEGDEKGAKELEALQYEFLDKHLIKWAPLYLINVINEASTPFYHDSAMMTLDFLLGDFEYLAQRCND